MPGRYKCSLSGGRPGLGPRSRSLTRAPRSTGRRKGRTRSSIERRREAIILPGPGVAVGPRGSIPRGIIWAWRPIGSTSSRVTFLSARRSIPLPSAIRPAPHRALPRIQLPRVVSRHLRALPSSGDHDSGSAAPATVRSCAAPILVECPLIRDAGRDESSSMSPAILLNVRATSSVLIALAPMMSFFSSRRNTAPE
jgi:hypothetical protein